MFEAFNLSPIYHSTLNGNINIVSVFHDIQKV